MKKRLYLLPPEKNTIRYFMQTTHAFFLLTMTKWLYLSHGIIFINHSQYNKLYLEIQPRYAVSDCLITFLSEGHDW